MKKAFYLNIDADDTMFYCEAETVCRLLCEAEEYAVDNRIKSDRFGIMQ